MICCSLPCSSYTVSVMQILLQFAHPQRQAYHEQEACQDALCICGCTVFTLFTVSYMPVTLCTLLLDPASAIALAMMISLPPQSDSDDEPARKANSAAEQDGASALIALQGPASPLLRRSSHAFTCFVPTGDGRLRDFQWRISVGPGRSSPRGHDCS